LGYPLKDPIQTESGPTPESKVDKCVGADTRKVDGSFKKDLNKLTMTQVDALEKE